MNRAHRHATMLYRAKQLAAELEAEFPGNRTAIANVLAHVATLVRDGDALLLDLPTDEQMGEEFITLDDIDISELEE